MNRIITKYRISFITSNALDNEERSKSNSLYAYLLWIQNTFFFFLRRQNKQQYTHFVEKVIKLIQKRKGG